MNIINLEGGSAEPPELPYCLRPREEEGGGREEERHVRREEGKTREREEEDQNK